MTISGLLGCDLCNYSLEDLEVCQCHEDCDNTSTEEADEEYYECLDRCTELIPPLVAPCQNQCEQDYEDAVEDIVNDCKEEQQCGEEPIPARNPVEYRYQLFLWHNTGFTEDYSGTPTEFIQSEDIPGAPPTTIIIDLATLPLATGETVSYCYISNVVVEYDDGTCCTYNNFGCVLKG